jgi:sugar O-acyltransferase (sialic acid O-acetyltransferase NeuD family)
MNGRTLYIVGAGGMGRELMDLAMIVNTRDRGWSVLRYVDDHVSGTVDGCEVAGGDEFLLHVSEKSDVVLGIADPEIKATLFTKLSQNLALSFPRLIHPSAFISPAASVGMGAVIQYGSWVSTSVVLGQFVFVNVGCHIGHDSRVGDFSSLMATVDLGGHDDVDALCYFGTKSTVVPGVHIGTAARVGAASLVVGSVPDHTTVMGNPARVLPR